jgi:hypothetical protein
LALWIKLISVDQAKMPSSKGTLSIAFVGYTGPGTPLASKDESVIRRHAMKEIGKSRRRPKHKKVIELDVTALEEDDDSQQRPPSWWLGRLWTQTILGFLDPFVQYPVELDHVGRGLVANSQFSRCLP